MSNEQNALVPHDSPSKAVESWGFGQLIGRFFSTLNVQSPEHKTELFNLLNCPGQECNAYVNRELIITAYLMQPVTRTNDVDGQESTFLETKFRLHDGTVLKTGSETVAKSLLQAGELLGYPSVERPYRCALRDQPSKRVGPDGKPRRFWYLDFAYQKGTGK